MNTLRYDKTAFRATKTDEGFLVDFPVVGRIGIQRYQKADGSIYRELRLPEEVFNADSLSSFAGKPITFGHPDDPVNAENAKQLTIGTMQSDGVQDGDHVRSKIVIHDGESIKKIERLKIKELSLGYSVTLDETPGIWNGQEYDAIQRNIKINHLAVVEHGRAGVARLNLDRLDAVSFFDEVETMTQVSIRVDGGLEYKADPEVALELEKVRKAKLDADQKLQDFAKRADALEAERDTLKSEVAKIEKIKADSFEAGVLAQKELSKLAEMAKTFNVDHDGKTAREIKEAVIKSIRVDADLKDKSDDYVSAAFDMVVELKADSTIADQRQTVSQKIDGVNQKTDAYKEFMANLGKKEQK